MLSLIKLKEKGNKFIKISKNRKLRVSRTKVGLELKLKGWLLGAGMGWAGVGK